MLDICALGNKAYSIGKRRLRTCQLQDLGANLIQTSEYKKWQVELKNKLLIVQLKVAVAVNKERQEFYSQHPAIGQLSGGDKMSEKNEIELAGDFK